MVSCRRKGCGGVVPPRVTEEMKPSRWRPSIRLTCNLETGIEVRPRRALDAFWRCEHTCARLTRDMVTDGEFAPSRGSREQVGGQRVQLAREQCTARAMRDAESSVDLHSGWRRRRRRPCASSSSFVCGQISRRSAVEELRPARSLLAPTPRNEGA